MRITPVPDGFETARKRRICDVEFVARGMG